MRTGIILFLILQMELSFGFHPELDHAYPADTLAESNEEGYEYNQVENVDEEPRHGCRPAMSQEEQGGIKLIVRLKRMANCRG